MTYLMGEFSDPNKSIGSPPLKPIYRHKLKLIEVKIQTQSHICRKGKQRNKRNIKSERANEKESTFIGNPRGAKKLFYKKQRKPN